MSSGLEPSLLTTQMSWLRVRVETNAMCWPSGAQLGLKSRGRAGLGFLSAVAWLVKQCWSEPSAFIMQISLLPSRSESKAICEPSGDHVGSESLNLFSLRLV